MNRRSLRPSLTCALSAHMGVRSRPNCRRPQGWSMTALRGVALFDMHRTRVSCNPFCTWNEHPGSTLLPRSKPVGMLQNSNCCRGFSTVTYALVQPTQRIRWPFDQPRRLQQSSMRTLISHMICSANAPNAGVPRFMLYVLLRRVCKDTPRVAACT